MYVYVCDALVDEERRNRNFVVSRRIEVGHCPTSMQGKARISRPGAGG